MSDLIHPPWLWLAMSWLATWRITALLVYEPGPFGIAQLARDKAMRTPLRNVLACFHCASLWVALSVVLSTRGMAWPIPLDILAVAGAASITERFLGGALQPEGEKFHD